MSVRRYSMELRTMMGDSWQDLVRDDDGEWMRYEDHLDVAQMYRDEFKLRLAVAAELVEVKKHREEYSMLAAQLHTRNRELEASAVRVHGALSEPQEKNLDRCSASAKAGVENE